MSDWIKRVAEQMCDLALPKDKIEEIIRRHCPPEEKAVLLRKNAAPDLCRDIDTLINIIEQLLKEKKRK